MLRIIALNFVAKAFLLQQTKPYFFLPLFYNYDIPSIRNCQVKSVLLPDAHQAFYLADGMYQVVSSETTSRMKNDSRFSGFSMSTLSCHACIIRPSCNSILSSNQSDLVLTPTWTFVKPIRYP